MMVVDTYIKLMSERRFPAQLKRPEWPDYLTHKRNSSISSSADIYCGVEEDRMYVNPNFNTKKELKKAVAEGKTVTVFSPGPFPAKTDGIEFIEGPHYPKLHVWYAKVEVKEGKVVKVIS